MTLRPTYRRKLARIVEHHEERHLDVTGRSLMHAYVGCLSANEAQRAVLDLLHLPLHIRRAVLNRLVRTCEIGRENGKPVRLDDYAERLIAFGNAHPVRRAQTDYVLSTMLPFFSPVERRGVVEMWMGRGTKAADNRWLKAMQRDSLLFNEEEILACWRHSKHDRAEKIIAYECSPSTVATVLGELLDKRCPGWIVGRAFLRADIVRPEMILRLEDEMPATFLYYCVKKGVPVSDDQALRAVERSSGKADEGDRGLAIWAVGQLGRWNVLEELRSRGPLFEPPSYLSAIWGDIDPEEIN